MLSAPLFYLFTLFLPFLVQSAPVPVAPEPRFDFGKIGDAVSDFFGGGGGDGDNDSGKFNLGKAVDKVGKLFGGDNNEDAAGGMKGDGKKLFGLNLGQIGDKIGDIFGAGNSNGKEKTIFGVSLDDIKDIVGDVGDNIGEAVTDLLDGGSDAPTSTEATTAFSAAEVTSTLLRPAQFARVAYCSGAVVTSLTCGAPCEALGPNVEVLRAGGDDGFVPMFFIAHDADTNTIVVAHQGTEPDNILSILNSAEFFLTEIDEDRFTSAQGLGIKVHSGFQRTFERTADGILATVKQALTSTGATKVLVTGHSLGGAIASLDAMFFKQELDSSIDISAITFGLPRVGNEAWANFVDNQLGTSFLHVSNQNDPVPIVPPRFLGFQHPAGEIHINTPDTDIVFCPGQENENCSKGNSLFDSSVADHAGPYFAGVSFGGAFCPL